MDSASLLYWCPVTSVPTSQCWQSYGNIFFLMSFLVSTILWLIFVCPGWKPQCESFRSLIITFPCSWKHYQCRENTCFAFTVWDPGSIPGVYRFHTVLIFMLFQTKKKNLLKKNWNSLVLYIPSKTSGPRPHQHSPL